MGGDAPSYCGLVYRIDLLFIIPVYYSSKNFPRGFIDQTLYNIISNELGLIKKICFQILLASAAIGVAKQHFGDPINCQVREFCEYLNPFSCSTPKYFFLQFLLPEYVNTEQILCWQVLVKKFPTT